VAQDDADETAETESKPAQPEATLEDLRKAMGAYANTYGMVAATEDGAKIFDTALGKMPEGTKNAKGEVIKQWALTAVPADKIAVAVKYWQGALSENPFAREEVK
jgi:hypothetical protein